MTRAVRIPVTVKMRAGWNDALAQCAGARAPRAGCRRRRGDHSRPHRGAVLLGSRRLGPRGARWPTTSTFPCSAAATASSPTKSSRGCGWASAACSSGAACCAIPGSWRRPRRWRPATTPVPVTLQQRGDFLRAYIRLLLDERVARGRRLPSPRARRRSGRRRRHAASRARARPGALGDQQGARALRVVFEGARGWLDSAFAGEHRRTAWRSSTRSSTQFFAAEPAAASRGDPIPY